MKALQKHEWQVAAASGGGGERQQGANPGRQKPACTTATVTHVIKPQRALQVPQASVGRTASSVQKSQPLDTRQTKCSDGGGSSQPMVAAHEEPAASRACRSNCAGRGPRQHCDRTSGTRRTSILACPVL